MLNLQLKQMKVPKQNQNFLVSAIIVKSQALEKRLLQI